MGSNYKNKMSYEVDLVFCIDATMSMDPILDKVKSNALNFYQDFQKEMDEKGKKVSQLRIRIVAFRDYYYDRENAMMVTNFFNLPEQADEEERKPHENRPFVVEFHSGVPFRLDRFGYRKVF